MILVKQFIRHTATQRRREITQYYIRSTSNCKSYYGDKNDKYFIDLNIEKSVHFHCICQYIIIGLPITALKLNTAVDPNAIFPLFSLLFIRDMTSFDIILKKLILTFDV